MVCSVLEFIVAIVFFILINIFSIYEAASILVFFDSS